MATPTLDAGFPVLSTQTGTTQSKTSATFNVSGSRLVVVLVAYDADPNTNFPTTVSWNGGTPAGAAAFTKATSIAGTSSHVGTFTDAAEVWTAWVSAPLTAVSVTCALSAAASTAQDRAFFVEAWANTQATLGGVNSVFATGSAARAVSVVCVGTGSVVVGICGSFFTGGAGVADANSTLDGNGNVGADTQAALHLTTPTSGPGTFTIGLTGVDTDRVAAAIELLPSGGGMTPSTRGPWGNPRLMVRGPGSRFRHATWASTKVSSTAPIQYTQAADGTLSMSGLLVNQTQKVLAGTMTSTGLLVNRTGKVVSGALTSSGLLVKQTGKVVAGTLTSSGSLAKQVGKVLSGVLASAGALVKQTGKVLAGTLTSSGAITAFKVALVSLAGTLTSSGTLTKHVGKSLAGTLAPVGTLSKRIFVSMAGTLTSAGALIGQKVATAARKVFIFIFDD